MSETAKNLRILDAAAKLEDPLLRLAYIAVWAASHFAGTRKRLYKPFNPLLGETYELEGSNFRLFGEQYSHHPPIGVVCIEGFDGKTRDRERLQYRVRVNTNVKTAFWGKYVDIAVMSPLVVELTATGEVFECWMPGSSVNNIIIGKMFIDHHGALKVVNRGTGQTVELDLQGYGGWFKKAADRGAVTGMIKVPSPKGKPLRRRR